MPLTAAEKMKRYRERLKLNPEKFEGQRKKNLERIKSKYKYKKVSDMSKHEKNKKRKQWRDEKRRQKDLLSLKDIVKPRVSTGKMRSRYTSNTYQDADIKNIQSTYNNHFTPSPSSINQGDDYETSQQTASTSSPASLCHTKRPKKSYNNKLLDTEQQKLQFLRAEEKSCHSWSNEDDENILFFKSLLTHVKKIPQHKILSFRNRIQDVVEEFAYKSHVSYDNRLESSLSDCTYLSSNSNNSADTDNQILAQTTEVNSAPAQFNLSNSIKEEVEEEDLVNPLEHYTNLTDLSSTLL